MKKRKRCQAKKYKKTAKPKRTTDEYPFFLFISVFDLRKVKFAGLRDKR
ncbi:MAG: hypothetical protein JSV88_07045 [Candidatus Aminicenantes bacterium]|nr:MAG: hypothetical protein JSV88_07045 [Candidatus Aminicenantes bacterium]